MTEMTPDERHQAMKALGDDVDDVAPDFSLGEVKRKGKTPHAVKVDVWGRRKADKIVDQWELEDEAPKVRTDADGEEYTPKAVESPEVLIADGHMACFDPQPILNENCNDEIRRRWFRDLLDSPDYNELHHATCLDPELSEIASVRIYRQYQEYLHNLTPDEQDDIEGSEPDDRPVGPDGFPNPHGDPSGQSGTGKPPEDWEQKVNRGDSVQEGIQQAENDVRDAQDAADALGWGNGTGQSETLGSGVLDAFKKLRDNPQFRAISEAAGRFRRLAKSLQQSKFMHGMDDVVGVTLGDEINRLVPSELMKLVDEDLETDLLLKLHEKSAICRDYRSIEKVGRGPIMVLVDESYSMKGDNIIAAKGLALSLAWLARHQKRWCCLVGWASTGRISKLVLDPNTPNGELMDWALSMLCGGTNPPVAKIPELFLETNAPEGKTDIIWITDGECFVDDDVVEDFDTWRKEHKCKVWTIGIGCAAESFARFSDKCVQVSKLGTTDPVIEEILRI